MAAAGRRAWECHFLTCSPRDFHRLLRCLQQFCPAWERGRARLSAFRDARERTRAPGPRPPREARGPRRAAWVLFPAPSILPSDGFSKTKSKHPVSLARPQCLPFFPLLQILGSSSSGNAGRKLAREGGGGWKFLAALCLCVYGAEEVGGWVEESGVGERTRSPPSCSATGEITGQLGRKSPLSDEDPRPSRPGRPLPAPPTAL